MSRIGKISLYWYLDKKNTLDNNVEMAMEAWEKRPELRHEFPSRLLLNKANKDLLKEFNNAYQLDVVFARTIQKDHIQIESK